MRAVVADWTSDQQRTLEQLQRIGASSAIPLTEAFDAYCRYQLEKALGMLEERLISREYILDRGFSAADISMGYALMFAAACTGATFSPLVTEYFGRLMTRPAMRRALDDIPAEQLAMIA